MFLLGLLLGIVNGIRGRLDVEGRDGGAHLAAGSSEEPVLLAQPPRHVPMLGPVHSFPPYKCFVKRM